MSKFLEYLSEPQLFSDGSWVCTQEGWTQWDFLQYLNESDDREYTEEDIKYIKEDWVHFHIGEDDTFGRDPAWWLGSKGMRGAKPVWSF